MKFVKLALLGLILGSNAAAALDFCPDVYFGGELLLQKLKINNNYEAFKQSPFNRVVPSVDLILGSRLTENFGLEAGYTLPARLTRTNTITVMSIMGSFSLSREIGLKVSNVHFDAIGYLPMNDAVNLIGSLGMGRLTTKLSYKVNGTNGVIADDIKKDAKAKVGLRIGLGAEYFLSENVSTRLMFHYQKGNKIIKAVNSAGLGLFYNF